VTYKIELLSVIGILCIEQSCRNCNCCDIKINFSQMMGSLCRGVPFMVYVPEHCSCYVLLVNYIYIIVLC
jgi:hypothetical protein